MNGSVPGGARAVEESGAQHRSTKRDGSKPVVSAAAALFMTYEDLRLLAERCRREGLIHRGEDSAEAGEKNIRRQIKIWMELLGRSPTDPVDAALANEADFSQLYASLEGKYKAAGASSDEVRKFRSEMRKAHEFYVEKCAEIRSVPSADTYSQLKAKLRELVSEYETTYAIAKNAASSALPAINIRLILDRIVQRRPRQYSRKIEQALTAVEEACRLQKGELVDLYTPDYSVSPSFKRIPSEFSNVRNHMLRHLPDDYDARPEAERREIAQWILDNVLRPPSAYREFMVGPGSEAYALWFPGVVGQSKKSVRKRRAGPQLIQEMTDLIDHMTALRLPASAKRRERWARSTAETAVHRLGRFLGALSGGSLTRTRGLGFDAGRLTLGILASTNVINWYLGWSQERRGFVTVSEKCFLILACTLLNPDTGWLVQRPHVAHRLTLLPGLVTQTLIDQARSDWRSVLAEAHAHCVSQIKDIEESMLKHRDPFYPINVVLDHDRPLDHYIKIAKEIKGRIGELQGDPMKEAMASRDYIMFRIASATGFRQKNLRELLAKRKGEDPTTPLQLQIQRRAELRYVNDYWEIYAPYQIFKNSSGKFFSKKPMKIVLEDRGGLYRDIDAFMEHYRDVILESWENSVKDNVRELFVIPKIGGSKSPVLNGDRFYQAWVRAIRVYGIYNPYTGKGAIPGLLPHGPHAMRDVIATHVLRLTGSFERAAYAIQDAPATVEEHYGKYGPGDKHAHVSAILSAPWGEKDDE